MRNILLIEDDLLSQKTMKAVLKNYVIDCCKSAEDYYSNFNKKKYDLIIMDISLGKGKDGLQLTREIKMDGLDSTPILCLTAHAFRSDKKNAYDAGVDFYLSKPVSNAILNETIERLINVRTKF